MGHENTPIQILYKEINDSINIMDRDKPEHYEIKSHELKRVLVRIQQLLLDDINK